MIKHLLSFVVLCATINLIAYGFTQYGLNGITTTGTNENLSIDPNGTGETDITGNTNITGNMSVDNSATGAASMSMVSSNTTTDTVNFGDTDSGTVGQLIYDHVANDFSYTIGGSADEVVIDADGIGLGGVTNPTSILDAKLAGDTDGIILESSASANTVVDLGQNAAGDGTLTLDNDSGTSGVFLSANETLAQDSYFRYQLAVGKTVAAYSLDVFDSNIYVARFDGSNSVGTGVRINSSATGGDEWAMVSAADGSSAVAGSFGLYNFDTIGYRLIVESTGEVGIGTNDPEFPLDLIGTSQTMLRIQSANSSDTVIRLDNTASGGDDWRIHSAATFGTTAAAGSFAIINADTGAGMTIGSTGAMCVDCGGSEANNSAAANLHVKGDGALRLQHDSGSGSHADFISDGVGDLTISADDSNVAANTDIIIKADNTVIANGNTDGWTFGSLVSGVGPHYMYGGVTAGEPILHLQTTNTNLPVFRMQNNGGDYVQMYNNDGELQLQLLDVLGLNTLTTVARFDDNNGSYLLINQTNNTADICTTTAGTGIKLLSLCSSSERYKKNIVDLSDEVSEKIYDLRPVQFDWKNTDKHDYGLIAEEVDEHLPELVPKNDKGQPESVNYKHLVSLLIKEVQKLEARVAELEAQL